jgi:cytochrome c peroxidase
MCPVYNALFNKVQFWNGRASTWRRRLPVR